MEQTIEEHAAEIESLRQKIKVNELLKEVDVDELKMMRENNLSVNSALSDLVGKWEALEEATGSKK